MTRRGPRGGAEAEPGLSRPRDIPTDSGPASTPANPPTKPRRRTRGCPAEPAAEVSNTCWVRRADRSCVSSPNATSSRHRGDVYSPATRGVDREILGVGDFLESLKTLLRGRNNFWFLIFLDCKRRRIVYLQEKILFLLFFESSRNPWKNVGWKKFRSGRNEPRSTLV